MKMLFNEIFGIYYNTVSKIIILAIENKLTEETLYNTIIQNAFSESHLSIIPALKNEKWQLINKDFSTPIKNIPTIPLTILEKRWLKSISLDPKIKLFDLDLKELESISPLFTPEDYYIFDQYNDGDPFEDENYIKNFKTILKCIKEQLCLKIEYINRKNKIITIYCKPIKIEYSQKDDKFRLISQNDSFIKFLNISKIKTCKIINNINFDTKNNIVKSNNKSYFILQLTNLRNALERFMIHFAHFEKYTKKIDEINYEIKVFYNSNDEAELVIRVLSFGPLVKVIEPLHFKNLIIQKLIMQKKCNLK